MNQFIVQKEINMVSETETISSDNEQKENSAWHVFILIGLLSVIILGSMGYVLWLGNHMIAVQTPVLDASMEIRLEAAKAHLWFEEIIAGDKNEDINKVMEYINKADWFAKVMLEGGENSIWTFSPLEDETVRKGVIEIRKEIADFKQITLERWHNRESSGIGTDIDQKYDKVFEDLNAKAAKAEIDLQRVLNRQLRNFKIFQGVLIGICILVTITVAGAIGKLLRRQVMDKTLLNSMNQQLNATNQQLQAGKQKLSAANQQLKAHEQQLLAVNQQLKASEQQLLAANQQLNANNQHLMANEQHLKSINKQLEYQILERRKIEHALELARREAELANTFKSQFLANMSHEIRTPMNAVLGFSELLSEEELTDLQREYVNTLCSSGKHLLELINDILDFSKIEAGKLNIEMNDCSLRDLLAVIESMIHPLAKEKDLKFEIREDSDLPANVRTDQTRLQQCLINLVNNAVKFTEKGHVYVNISVEDKNNQPHIRFDVEDTGIGIPADRQESIFESFTQADGSNSRKYGGTGLGLTITRQLAKLLGGELTLTSEVGKGSVFSIVIPTGLDITKQPLLDRHEVANHKNTTGNLTEQPEFSGHALVAEDVEANQMLVKALLKRMGLEVTIAIDGNDAVDKALAQEFDLIFMDIQMPHLNGYEATKALRRKGLTTPIIALTAHAMKGDDRKCIDAGCDDYLAKPIDRKGLLFKIAEYLPSRNQVACTTVDSAVSQVDELTELCSGRPAFQTKLEESGDGEIIKWHQLIDRFGGDENLVKQILPTYLRDIRKHFDELLEAVRTGDSKEIRTHAHAIKGAGGNLGAKRLPDVAGKLEIAGLKNNAEAFTPLFDKLAVEFEELMTFLSAADWMEIAKSQANNQVEQNC